MNEFDLAAKKIIEAEEKKDKAEAKNIENENVIAELNKNNNELVNQNKKSEEKYSELKNEFEFLKEGYDEIIKENMTMRKENENKTAKISTLESELSDMKNVIAKLTEVRVILNKYFSSHFESFT